jgi:protein tyrosine/serine phosphatase
VGVQKKGGGMAILKSHIISFVLLAFCCSGFAGNNRHRVFNEADLPHFYEVVKGELYRGAQPTTQGLQALHDAGVKTILNLRNERDLITQEKKVVESIGMTYISVPLSGFFKPADADMDKIEALLNDPQARPLFVHCQHGKDRTGLAYGLYRIFTQGWTPQAAHDEMVSLGFNTLLFGLEEYFDEKTGYQN